jgi:hypothetical protein
VNSSPYQFILRILSSAWKSALAGAALGALVTILVVWIDALFHANSGHGNFTFLLRVIIVIPQQAFFGLTGMLGSPVHHELLNRFGWKMTLAFNALFGCTVFFAISIGWRILRRYRSKTDAAAGDGAN